MRRGEKATKARLGTVVSIHAPAWGATTDPRPAACRRPCFNPRTRVGCDKYSANVPLSEIKFQSTHPRGVRQRRCHLWPLGPPVSIHAPAWGATSGISACSPSHPMFQSTHPRGVRPAQGGSFERWRRVSIHAPAWGATRAVCSIQRPRCGSFNPRTRVGCDLVFTVADAIAAIVSIHAPAWGATLSPEQALHHHPVSIHAPAWGATQPVAETVRGQDGVSIHAPAWGATADTDGGWDAARVSIHAPAWGATWGAGKLWR